MVGPSTGESHTSLRPGLWPVSRRRDTGRRESQRTVACCGIGMPVRFPHARSVALIETVTLHKVFQKPEKAPGIHASVST
jgi:hypothetical protein